MSIYVRNALRRKMSPRISKSASKRLKENVDLFQSINKLSDKDKRLIVKYLNNDGIMRFCELILNILKGRINLSSNDILKLRKYKRPLRYMINRSRAISKKRSLLIQKGGFLGALLGIGASLLPPLIEQVVNAVK